MPQIDLFALLAIITVVSAIFSYINIRFLRLPNTIGLMALALALSLSAYRFRQSQSDGSGLRYRHYEPRGFL
jgi:hypothetical protein